MNFHKILFDLWREHRVPLALLIFTFNHQVFTFGFNNLVLQKTCFPEGPPGTNVICNNTEAFKEYNSLSSVRVVTRELLSGLTAMLAGPWRDHTGLTMPLIVAAHLGDVVASVAVILSSVFWDYSTWATVVVDSICGLLGSRIFVTMAVMSYVSAHSPEEKRTIRLTELVAANLGGMCLANAASGFLMSSLGYTWLFVVLMAAFLLNLALFFYSVKDGPRKNPGVKMKPIHVFTRLKAVFIPRKNYFVICAMLFASFAIAGVMVAENTIINGFLQKVLFINPESAGLLLSFRLLFSLIASLIATPVLIKVFKMSEFTVSIFSTIPTAISCFGMAFVSTLWEAYIFYGLDLMRVTLTSLFWAILSYCVPKSEVGVYVSFLLFGEAISPLLINPLYVYIFNSTIEYFPGAFFIVSGTMALITTALLIISYFKFEKLEEEADEKSVKIAKDDSELKISVNQQKEYSSELKGEQEV